MEKPLRDWGRQIYADFLFIRKAFLKCFPSVCFFADFTNFIQLEGIFMMPYFHLIRENNKSKVALRTHNVEHQIWERAIPDSKPVLRAFLKNQTKKLKRYEHWCAKEVDAVVAISENDAN